MKNLVTTLFAGVLVAGATCQVRADHPVPRADLQPGAEPQVFTVEKHNGAMRKAVHQARKTLPVFIAALTHPGPGQSDFQVKKPFMQNGEVEHLWLSDVTFSGNRFHGYVDNMPRKIKGLKMGDRVSVNANEISDWAFIDNGRLVGGYTIRVLYSQLPPDQKAALEKEARFRIENPS